MNKLCVPYKNCVKSHITQGYSDTHKAWDFAKPKNSYGTWLVAMENCIVERITEAENFDNGWEYDRGFGILLRSIEDPTIKYSYWHCLQFFPVKIGQIILMGHPIAQMGNSGYVIGNGVYVPLADRTKPPYRGTHLHLSAPLDTLDRIDWSIPINFNVITAVSLVLQKMINFIKTKK